MTRALCSGIGGCSLLGASESSTRATHLTDQRFYFVHSYGVRDFPLARTDGPPSPLAEPLVTWAEHGDRFVAAVENGPLSATQFHPEKSGDAGAALLTNWLQTLS